MKLKAIKRILLYLPLVFLVIFCSRKSKESDVIPDPLPSWNESAVKKSIISFVVSTTTNGNTSLIQPSERIAVFDNDGTLWAEQPMYFQFLFAVDRAKEMVSQHPELKTKEPFRSLATGDMKKLLAGGEKALAALIFATHTGLTTEAFDSAVRNWITTAKHPRFKKLYIQCVYQPMLELLAYLRENGYKTFIVSGGDIEFMRVWSQQIYGIPSEQVVGSSFKVKYQLANGKPVLIRQPQFDFMDDKEGKPVGINAHIGRRPAAAFGNSDGDFQMLEWTTAGNGKRFGMLVHHDDPVREWAYDRTSHIGQLNRGLDEADKKGWIIVSMKNDWKKIFPGD